MPRHPHLFICLLILSSGFACAGKKDNGFRDQFRWLSGKWEGRQGNVQMVEHWRWNKHRFEGFGYEITNGDTTFSEKLFLEDYDGKPCYVAVLPKQGPTLFAGQMEDDDQWIFTNGEHDFPSRIRYVYEADTAMHITLMSQQEPDRPVASYRLRRTK